MNQGKQSALGLVPPERRTCEEIQDAIVVSLRRGDDLSVVGWRQHEQECEGCASFLRLTARAREHFVAPELSAAEVKRLKLRLAPQLRPAGQRVGSRRKAPWLLAAFLGLGASAAFAYGNLDSFSAPEDSAPTGTPQGTTSPATEKGRSDEARATSSEKQEAVGEADGGAPRREKSAFRAAENQSANTVEKSPVEGAGSGVDPRSKAPAGAAAQERLKWAHAAEALRNDDSAQADRALRDLSESTDENTRERAQLGLAQLSLKEGRKAEAKALLRKLTKSRSAFVRGRASELLR